MSSNNIYSFLWLNKGVYIRPIKDDSVLTTLITRSSFATLAIQSTTCSKTRPSYKTSSKVMTYEWARNYETLLSSANRVPDDFEFIQ